MALTTNYDSIIVDLMLPSLSGLEIVKGIRRERIQTPILILTAQSQVDQRVKGLDAGADDYLTKPFAIDELLARVRALLRRGATDSPGILQIDDLVLNPATREVTRGGQRIELTLKEYALLEYLMRHTGRVLTRPMISEHVWNQDFDTFTNVIDVYVNYLRNKVDRGRTKTDPYHPWQWVHAEGRLGDGLHKDTTDAAAPPTESLVRQRPCPSFWWPSRPSCTL